MVISVVLLVDNTLMRIGALKLKDQSSDWPLKKSIGSYSIKSLN